MTNCPLSCYCTPTENFFPAVDLRRLEIPSAYFISQAEKKGGKKKPINEIKPKILHPFKPLQNPEGMLWFKQSHWRFTVTDTQTRSQRLSWDHMQTAWKQGSARRSLSTTLIAVQTYNTILKLILSVNSGSKSDPVNYRVGSSAGTLEEYWLLSRSAQLGGNAGWRKRESCHSSGDLGVVREASKNTWRTSLMADSTKSR